MKKISIMILIWLLLSGLLAACADRLVSNNPPYSILDKSFCTLPCWNNIIPGETSKIEFLDIISALKYVDQSSIIEINSSSKIYDKVIRFEIKPDQKRENVIDVDASLQDDKVIVVSFLGQLGLTLGEIVSDIGEPEDLLTMTLPGGYSAIIMLDQSKGLMFEHGTYDTNVNLEQNTPITALIIFSSDYYEKLIDEGMFSAGLYKKDDTLRIMYPWSGYGNIKEKYPPRNP